MREPLEEAEDQVRHALEFIHGDNPGPIELRPTDRDGNRRSGFYTDRRKLAADAADFAGNAVYWTINEIAPRPVTNEIGEAIKDGCTKNRDVVRIRTLFIDADARRPQGQPSTETEHRATLDVVARIKDYLIGKGFPEPMVASSGNGHYLFYATDLPSSLAPLVRSFIEHLSEKFSNDDVLLDDSVSKLAQIARVPGTWNRKGTNTTERPHRKATILDVPDRRELVTADMLARLVPVIPDVPSEITTDNYPAAIDREINWLKSKEIKFDVETHHDEHAQYTIIRLAVCPFKTGEQTDGRTWLMVHPAYGISAGCFHAKCRNHGIDTLRKAVGGHDAFLEIAIGLTERPSDPHRLAQKHIDQWAVNGQRTTVYIGEELLAWKDSIYIAVTDKMMLPYITDTIKTEFDEHARNVKARGGRGTPSPVKRTVVGDTLNALKSLSRLERDELPPFWLVDHRWPANDVIPFNNGLLHLPTYLAGRADYFLSPSPSFFNRHKLAFNFDQKAPMPTRWNQFLVELWDDPACHDLLHEWGGYCMTRDTHLQKMMLLLGKTRGGKGTICWLLGQMVGGNFASPQFKSLLGEFGLAPLLGRQLALFPDTKMLSSRILEEVCAILKAITGEDPITVNIKHKGQVTEQLRLKIVIPSNDLLAIPDNSSALQARQLFLHFAKSFRGREDYHLKPKLLAELPGIANLFLSGLQRLYANDGIFTEPKASRELSRRVERKAIPLSGFVADICVLDGDYATPTIELYEAYSRWADDNEIDRLENNEFGKQLQEFAPAVSRSQNVARYKVKAGTSATSKRPHYYVGIRLKTDLDAIAS